MVPKCLIDSVGLDNGFMPYTGIKPLFDAIYWRIYMYAFQTQLGYCRYIIESGQAYASLDYVIVLGKSWLPVSCDAVTCTNAGILSIGPQGTKFCENSHLQNIHHFAQVSKCCISGRYQCCSCCGRLSRITRKFKAIRLRKTSQCNPCLWSGRQIVRWSSYGISFQNRSWMPRQISTSYSY